MDPLVGVVGCGYWGRNLVRVFRDIGALADVCDADADLAAEFADKYSVPARTLDDLLADDTIQAVAIASPAATHADLAGQALQAGKHSSLKSPSLCAPSTPKSSSPSLRSTTACSWSATCSSTTRRFWPYASLSTRVSRPPPVSCPMCLGHLVTH